MRWQGMVVAFVGLVGLAGCGVVPGSVGGRPGAMALASADPDAVSSPSAAGVPVMPGPSAETPAGESDDLALGRRHYREGRYEQAEQHFQRAAEQQPQRVDAWLGLGASYDKLKRFDRADRAYARAVRLVGRTAEVLNNQGYSYMLRGDLRRARETLRAAAAADPANPYVQNNLKLLREAGRRSRSAN